MQELHRTSEHASALQERLTRPENADALKTIERIDELLTRQGKRLAVEFNQADANRPGGVSERSKQAVRGQGRGQGVRGSGESLTNSRHARHILHTDGVL